MESDENRLKKFATLLSGALSVSDEGRFDLLENHGNDLLAVAGISSKGQSKTNPRNDSTCSVPTLLLHQNHPSQHSPALSKEALEKAAAHNLQSPITLQGSAIAHIPIILLWNLHKSFLGLVEARLKSTMQNLASQPGTIRNPRSEVLLEILLPSASPIRISTVVTSFRVLPFVPGNGTTKGTNILPLMLDVVVDCRVVGQTMPATFSLPGAIKGVFLHHVLERVNVVLDTKVLLQYMMQEARIVVRRAISIATQVASCVTRTLPQNVPSTLVRLTETLVPERQTRLLTSMLVAKACQDNKEATTVQEGGFLKASLSMPPPPSRPPQALSSTIKPFAATRRSVRDGGLLSLTTKKRDRIHDPSAEDRIAKYLRGPI